MCIARLVVMVPAEMLLSELRRLLTAYGFPFWSDTTLWVLSDRPADRTGCSSTRLMKAVARNTMNWIVRSRYRHALLECLRIGSRHTIRSEDQTMQALSGNAKNNLILSWSAGQREATSVPSRWMDPARQMNFLGAYRRKTTQGTCQVECCFS